MKIVQKLLAACLLTGGLMATAYAADKVVLPDSIGGEPTKAAIAKDALKKDAICTKCHDESETAPILSIYQTKHGVRGDSRTPTCQSCHGESEKHVKGIKDKDDTSEASKPAPDIVFKKGVYSQNHDKERAGQCLNCHKGTNRTHWDGSQHPNNGVACNDCHKVHKPADPVMSKKTQTEVCFTCHKEQRADSHKLSTHPIQAGKVSCADCHNPHGSSGPKLMKKETLNQTCFQCHAEKRGPFLWEHQPVTEDCANCHTPHGSNITPLLKSRPPFLCQECHDGPHSSASPVGPNAGGLQGAGSGYVNGSVSSSGSASGSATRNPNGTVNAWTVSRSIANPGTSATARACMNCHVMVHGSNSPAGAVLHR